MSITQSESDSNWLKDMHRMDFAVVQGPIFHLNNCDLCTENPNKQTNQTKLVKTKQTNYLQMAVTFSCRILHAGWFGRMCMKHAIINGEKVTTDGERNENKTKHTTNRPIPLFAVAKESTKNKCLHLNTTGKTQIKSHCILSNRKQQNENETFIDR